MKKINYIILILGLIIMSCDNKESDPLKVKIDSVQPSAAQYGHEVTITGKNFSDEIEGNVVRFGYYEAEILSASVSELKVVVPEGNPVGEVEMAVVANNQFDRTSFKYIITDVMINEVVPALAKKGETVRIMGYNFSKQIDGNVVLFGDKQAEIISASESQLEVIVPAIPIHKRTRTHPRFSSFFFT